MHKSIEDLYQKGESHLMGDVYLKAGMVVLEMHCSSQHYQRVLKAAEEKLIF